MAGALAIVGIASGRVAQNERVVAPGEARAVARYVAGAVLARDER
jgi:hypothetical protein